MHEHQLSLDTLSHHCNENDQKSISSQNFPIHFSKIDESSRLIYAVCFRFNDWYLQMTIANPTCVWVYLLCVRTIFIQSQIQSAFRLSDCMSNVIYLIAHICATTATVAAAIATDSRSRHHIKHPSTMSIRRVHFITYVRT